METWNFLRISESCNAMKNIYVVPNKNKDTGYCVSRQVAEKLREYGANLYISKSYDTDLDGLANPVDEVSAETDLILVIGGDGSVIDASILAVERDIPVLGVNLGNLGYLAEVEPDELGTHESDDFF